MPFTPYHFGPSGTIGLVLRRWLDVPMFLLANVIIDIEVLAAPGRFPHRHWHWHTLLVGGLVGAALGAAVHLAIPLRVFIARLMNLARIRYEPRLAPMMLGGLTGAWMHVIIDALYHYDVQPFWPASTNPFYNFAGQHGLTQPCIRAICLAFWGVAIILYAAAVWSFYRNRSRSAPNAKGS